jgi:3-hydroxyisobutyrate dehydrogenase
MTESRIAVLGAGIMGSPMARNLARAGFPTTAWSRSPAATAALGDAGVEAAASPADAVRGASIVVTMLPTADVVTSVIFDAGLLDAFERNAIWAQMGTLGIAETERIAARVRQTRPDIRFVDAPVSGSKGPAERGQLVILASGPRDAQPVLERPFAVMGRKTVWLGEAAGQGTRMKIVLNAYMAILVEGAAEALELASRFGIGHTELLQALAGGPLEAPLATAKMQKMAAGDFAPEFPLVWALKDVDLALAAAGADPPPVLAALSPRWHETVNAGHGREDVSAARRGLGPTAKGS